MSASIERLRSAPLFRPLRRPDLRDFWLGQSLVSTVGDQITLVALTWLALELTGSGVGLGLVLTVAAVPRAALMLVGGAMSDRHSPRTVMLVTNAIRGVVTLVLGLLVLTGELQFWQLLVLAAGFGVMDAFFYPAISSIVPGLVPEEQLEASNALVQGTMQLMGLFGPAVGGILVASLTTAPAFLIDAVTFGVAVLALLRIHYVRPTSPKAPAGAPGAAAPTAGGLRATIVAGLRYAWGDPGLRAVLLAIAVMDFAFAGAVGVGLPWLAEARFGGPVAYGLMLAGASGGGLVGAVLAGSIGVVRRLGALLFGALLAMGVALSLVGLSPIVGPAIVLMALIGLGAGLLNVLAVASLQRKVEPTMLGRVMSLILLFSVGLSPVAYAISGPIVQASLPGFFLGAGLMVVLAAVTGMASGAMAYFDPTGAPPPEGRATAELPAEPLPAEPLPTRELPTAQAPATPPPLVTADDR